MTLVHYRFEEKTFRAVIFVTESAAVKGSLQAESNECLGLLIKNKVMLGVIYQLSLVSIMSQM